MKRLALLPLAALVIVACEDTTQPLESESEEPLTQFVLSGGPFKRAAAPEGLRQLVPKSQTVLTAAPEAIGPEEEIYVPNFSEPLGDVSVLDIEGLATLDRVPVMTRFPEAVAFSPDGRFAFISIASGAEVVVIDTDTRTVAKRIPVHFKQDPLIFVRPGGDRIYVSDCGRSQGPGTVTVIDVAAQEAIDVDPSTPQLDGITVPGAPWAMGFSPDGSRAYATQCGSGAGVHILDLTANVTDGFIPLDVSFVNGLEVSPNGQLAVATGGPFIVVVDLVQNREAGRLNCADFPEPCPLIFTQGVEFSADGSRAYVVDFLTNNLFTIDVTTPSNPQVLSTVKVVTTGNLWELEISGDVAFLIATRGFRFPSEVIRFDLSMDPPVQLNSGAVGREAFEIGLRPAFEPNLPPEVDGSLLAVEDHGDDDAEFIVQATATDPEDGTLTPTIDLVAIDENGNESVVASLNVGDKIRLRVDRDEVKVEVASGGELVDNEFNVRARASSFRVDFSVTDSGGLSDQDAVTVDLSVTEAIHEAEPDVSEVNIVIN